MKTSTIKSIQSQGIKNGWHNYEISLEDGTTAVKGFKDTPNHLTTGKEVQYEMNEKWPGLFKTIQVVGFNGQSKGQQFKADPAKQNSIEAQVALKSAIEFHAAFGFNDDFASSDSNTDQGKVRATADIFYEWLKSKS